MKDERRNGEVDEIRKKRWRTGRKTEKYAHV